MAPARACAHERLRGMSEPCLGLEEGSGWCEPIDRPALRHSGKFNIDNNFALDCESSSSRLVKAARFRNVALWNTDSAVA
jgi:hypothetical protein